MQLIRDGCTEREWSSEARHLQRAPTRTERGFLSRRIQTTRPHRTAAAAVHRCFRSVAERFTRSENFKQSKRSERNRHNRRDVCGTQRSDCTGGTVSDDASASSVRSSAAVLHNCSSADHKPAPDATLRRRVDPDADDGARRNNDVISADDARKQRGNIASRLSRNDFYVKQTRSEAITSENSSARMLEQSLALCCDVEQSEVDQVSAREKNERRKLFIIVVSRTNERRSTKNQTSRKPHRIKTENNRREDEEE